MDKVKKELNDLNGLTASVETLKEKVTVKLSDHIKKSLKEIPAWEPTNCAEIHVITALSEVDKRPLFTRVRSPEIEYMATYKVSNLEPFPRCSHCLITTVEPVKYVNTDSEWAGKLKKFKGMISSLDVKLDLSLRRPRPHVPATNKSEEAKNSSSTGTTLSRKRRHHHGDHLRHHNHLSRKPLATNISNQPEIGKSSGARPSSLINSFFWLGK